MAADAVAPRAGGFHVIAAILVGEFGAGEFGCHVFQTFHQRRAIRLHNGRVATQHLRRFGRHMYLAAADIDPHVFQTGHDVRIARQVLAPFGDRVTLVHADYRELERVLDAQGVSSVAGVLEDFGVSSMQLDAAGRVVYGTMQFRN